MGYVERKREQFTNIYRRYKDDVYQTCYVFTKCEESSRDITQQVFLEFYEHIEQSNIKYVGAYLLHAAKTRTINYMRKERRAREIEIKAFEANDNGMTSAESVEESYVQLETKRMQRDFWACVLDQMYEYNQKWYTATVLILVLDKPHDVVAEEMGITKDALYSMLYRMRKWTYKNCGHDYFKMKEML